MTSSVERSWERELPDDAPVPMTAAAPNLHQAAIADGTWDWTVAAQAVPPIVNPAARALWEILSVDDAPAK